ncbi:MAG: urate hydroxylase PuuD [Burkholderiaceae bacterium]|nr:urate hydroxylase PuuD [Burkholderiaceae bacterium]
MEHYLLDWASLLLRWAHVITAMAWIGASFYFVMLDNSLVPPEHADLKAKAVDGEMWAVHGGGFYHSNKYRVAPRWLPLPEKLHWSYWESYSTWLTGFGLFTCLYLFNASTFLIDKSVFQWTPAVAVGAALGLMAGFWVLYDALCRTWGPRRNGSWWVGVGVVVLIGVAAWLACHWFAGRAAFLLVGAMLATAMSANVFFWIIPGQRKVVAALRAGEQPDPLHGQRGKLRSLHNTYFTLPVLIAMLSNHYGWLYQGPHNWLVLLLLMWAGALIRHSFAARHKAQALGERTPWMPAVIGCGVLLGLVVWLAPAPQPPAARAAASEPVSFQAVRAVVAQRCALCHNAQTPNKGIALHTDALIAAHAQAIYQQVAVLRQMPFNNATQMSEGERLLIQHWFEAGAPTR